MLSVLNDSQAKLSAMRGALQAYRASESSAQSLVQTVVSLTSDSAGAFDHGSGDIIVQSLAEMLDGDKRSALQDAWSAVKVQPRTAPPRAPVRSVKSVAGNNRVWDNVARVASSSVMNSHEHFPTLGAQSSGAPARPAPGTRWAGAPARAPPRSSAAFPPLGSSAPQPQPRRVAPHSVAGPPSRGARVSMSESAFPSLPSNSASAEMRAQKRALLSNSARSPLVPEAPASRWGARTTPAMDDFPALGGVQAALPDDIPMRESGKQRRKRVLMSTAGGGRL